MLDPFAITFTIGEVALRCGGNFLGIELSKEYCDYEEHRLARAIEHLGDIEKATLDVKRARVLLRTLIDGGYLHPNERLRGTSAFAILRGDGKIMLAKEDGDKEGLTTDIHRGAALLTRAKAQASKRL